MRKGDSSDEDIIRATSSSSSCTSESSSKRRLTKREYAHVRSEVQKVVFPVSVAMWATVALVVALDRSDPDFEDGNRSGGRSMVSSAYEEKSTDSTRTKVIGSVENAFVFVLFVTAATFGLYVLFKHRCGPVIWAYMAFSGCSIFGGSGRRCVGDFEKVRDTRGRGFVCVLHVERHRGWRAERILWPGSLRVKQTFLVLISVIVAYYFVTQSQSGRRDDLLVFMAIYDLYAVLTPNGPLRKIVELSQEREEAIPALVYEARGGSGSW